MSFCNSWSPQFQANKSHISLVQLVDNTDPDRDPFPVTTGVVTMEVRDRLPSRIFFSFASHADLVWGAGFD
jgi:hypothetical protein